MTNRLLPFIPFPLLNESPTSVIQRTARMNGFSDCTKLIKYLSQALHQSRYQSYLLANSVMSKAFQTCWPDYRQSIKAIFYQPLHPLLQRPNIILKGVEILYANLRRNETALCTECLSEGHEKFPKDIKLFSNCPYHHRAFLSRCPGCGDSLNWKEQLTDICKCGTRLISPRVPAAKMRQDLYLLRLFESGDSAKLASIQRLLGILEHETSTTDESVKSARLTLAIETVREDVEEMKSAIHRCLPSATPDEIDLIMAFFKGVLSHKLNTKLRQELMHSPSPIPANVTIRLSLSRLIAHLGICGTTWYALRSPYISFKVNGRSARISLEDAIDIKRHVIASSSHSSQTGDMNSLAGQKQFLSLRVASDLTYLPENVIEILSVTTGLLGKKSRHIRQQMREEPPVFNRQTVDYFNQRYISAYRLSLQRHIPLSTIVWTLITHQSRLKGTFCIDGTYILHRRSIGHVLSLINTNKFLTKGAGLPKLSTTSSAVYVTSRECASLLSRPVKEIQHLMAKGIIPCHYKSPAGAYLTTRNDALKFRETHLYASDLSRKVNLSTTAVNRFLAWEGVTPVSGPAIDSGRTIIYAKSSIPSATIRKLKKHSAFVAQRRRVKQAVPDNTKDYSINLDIICSDLSISKHEIQRLFFSKKVMDYKKFGNARYVTISTQHKIAETLRGYMSLSQASHSLNIPESRLKKMHKLGKITLKASPYSSAVNPELISCEQVEKLRSNYQELTAQNSNSS